MPKEVDVKLRCQLRRGLSLSSIFEAKKPILKFWVLLFDVSKTKANDAFNYWIEIFETFYQLLKWKKLKDVQSIKNCANYGISM